MIINQMGGETGKIISAQETTLPTENSFNKWLFNFNSFT